VYSHMRSVSKPKVALAQEGGNGDNGGLPDFNFDINPLQFLTFVIDILVALDALLTRKNQPPQ